MTSSNPGDALPDEPKLNPGDAAEPGTPGTGENLCQECEGTGKIGASPCPICGGTGVVITGIGGG